MMAPSEQTHAEENATVTSPMSYGWAGAEVTLAAAVVVGGAWLLGLWQVAATVKVLPWLLLAGGVLPMVIGRASLGAGLFNVKNSVRGLKQALVCGLILFPLMAGAVWLAGRWGWRVPLLSADRPEAWGPWLIWLWLGVVIPEEVFFRGYVLGRLLSAADRTPGRIYPLFSVVISSALFAVGHAALLGEGRALLVFLPGMVLGWLFIRTRTLAGPVIFHGLANMFYVMVWGPIISAATAA